VPTIKRSNFSSAYRAGKKAVEGKTHYPAFLGAFLGLGIGEFLKEIYSLPWFESGPISVLLVVLFTFLVQFIEGRVMRARREKLDHP